MRCFLAFIAIFFAIPAFADTPLPPPRKATTCSAARALCVTSDPATGETRVVPQVPDTKPWAIEGWHRWLFPSDDGVSVVVGYEGMNLVPVDVAMDAPVLFFHHRGRLVRTITLDQLYRSRSQLRRTISHLAWVNRLRFNDKNQFVVELVDGRVVAFAPESGIREPLRGADTP